MSHFRTCTDRIFASTLFICVNVGPAVLLIEYQVEITLSKSSWACAEKIQGVEKAYLRDRQKMWLAYLRFCRSVLEKSRVRVG